MIIEYNTINRAKLRVRLLSNGYTPLPLHEKGLYIKGWSTATIDLEWLSQKSRDARHLNTGLRCDRLLAFDIDVLDDNLVLDIQHVIRETVGHTKLCRVGAEPKKLLVYRLTGEGGRSCRTGKFEDHRVELLCGPGHQFAAYGRHPSGCDYKWTLDSDPLNTHIDDIADCTHAKAVEAIKNCEQYFIEHGLEKQSNAFSREFNKHGELFDLTDQFQILLADGQETTWGKLKDTLDEKGVFGNIRREDDEYGDSNAIHFYISMNSKQPCAFDFVRDTQHWEPDSQPQLMEKLASVLPPQGDQGQAKRSMFAPTGYADLLRDWILVMEDGSVRHIDHPQRAYSLANFRESHKYLQLWNQNKPKKAPYAATKNWLEDPKTLRAHIVEMRPQSDLRLIQEPPFTVLNTYKPPVHPSTGGEIETVVEFIEHLVPNETERELFWDWHATKLVNPEYRMHCLIMVTPIYGTGRGTWNDILQRLFGLSYVKEVSLADMIGNGSQSAYNDYLADSLFVTVPEALEQREESHGWIARHIAFERLKQISEPQASMKHIKRKYGRNGMQMVYASILIATQHVDALAIPEGDRRLIVIENATESLAEAPNDLQTRIHDWKLKPENIGALEKALRLHARHSKYKPFDMPMMTTAKDTMIQIGRGEIDQAYDYMHENAQGDIVTHQQWLSWVYKARQELDLEIPIGPKADMAMSKVLQRRAWRIKSLPKSGQLKVKGTLVRPWIIRNRDKWEGNTSNFEIGQEIIRNGDPRGPNRSIGISPKKDGDD